MEHIVMKKNKVIHRKRKKSLNPYANIHWDKAAELFRQSLPAVDNGLFPKTKTLLHILAAAGAIGLIFAFPGAAPAIGNLVVGKNKFGRWQTKSILDQLAYQKYIKIKYNDDNTVTVKITRNGLVRALTYQLDSMKIKKPKRWDRKWRVVIFDIPEKYKRVRELFRMRLKQLELYPLQDSVYIHPFPCFKEIEFLRELYGISMKVEYLLVEKLEDDDYLRERFDLKA